MATTVTNATVFKMLYVFYSMFVLTSNWCTMGERMGFQDWQYSGIPLVLICITAVSTDMATEFFDSEEERYNESISNVKNNVFILIGAMGFEQWIVALVAMSLDSSDPRRLTQWIVAIGFPLILCFLSMVVCMRHCKHRNRLRPDDAESLPLAY